jgi:Tfp pilus assembly protein PilO
VSLTSRDRKIVMFAIPLALVLVYWFMILAPKQSEGDKVASELTKAQTKRDAAEQQVTQLNAAKASFASDYATVIRLGKAIPTTVDMPALLVQLNNAAKGTGVHIQDLKPGAASASASSSSGAGGSAAGAAQGGSAQSGANNGSTPPGGGSNPAAPGAAPAQSFPGKQAQKAGNAVTTSNNQSQGAANATANGPGSAGAAGSTGATPGSSSPDAPGLSKVPLAFTLKGSFFSLADFFHQLKRFVRVVNHQIEVRGRLLSIDSFQFQKAQNGKGDQLQATVSATVYLSPANQGVSAGASATGPQAPAAGGPASTPAGGSSTNPVTPTAAATP